MKPSLSFFSALISNIKPELFTASVYRDFLRPGHFVESILWLSLETVD